MIFFKLAITCREYIVHDQVTKIIDKSYLNTDVLTIPITNKYYTYIYTELLLNLF